jgi:hypothetical protein
VEKSTQSRKQNQKMVIISLNKSIQLQVDATRHLAFGQDPKSRAELPRVQQLPSE